MMRKQGSIHMNTRSRGQTYHGFSKRLGTMLLQADEDTLATVCDRILAELSPKATLPVVRAVVEMCVNDISSVSEEFLWKVKEDVYHELEATHSDDPVMKRDDIIIDICWGYALCDTIFAKCDSMIYQAGRLQKNERDDLLDCALNSTIGWYSQEPRQ